MLANSRHWRRIKSRIGAAWRARSQSGSYLIELLITSATASILATGLVANMAQVLTFSTSAQNQVTAATVAQQLIDNARATPYNTLASYAPGTYSMLMHRTQSGQVGPTPAPRPLVMDGQNFEWVMPSYNSGSGTWNYNALSSLEGNTFAAFQGSASEVLSMADLNGDGTNDSVRVVVTINWNERQSSKSLSVSTLIAQNGINCQ